MNGDIESLRDYNYQINFFDSFKNNFINNIIFYFLDRRHHININLDRFLEGKCYYINSKAIIVDYFDYSEDNLNKFLIHQTEAEVPVINLLNILEENFHDEDEFSKIQKFFEILSSFKFTHKKKFHTDYLYLKVKKLFTFHVAGNNIESKNFIDCNKINLSYFISFNKENDFKKLYNEIQNITPFIDLEGEFYSFKILDYISSCISKIIVIGNYIEIPELSLSQNFLMDSSKRPYKFYSLDFKTSSNTLTMNIEKPNTSKTHFNFMKSVYLHFEKEKSFCYIPKLEEGDIIPNYLIQAEQSPLYIKSTKANIFIFINPFVKSHNRWIEEFYEILVNIKIELCHRCDLILLLVNNQMKISLYEELTKQLDLRIMSSDLHFILKMLSIDIDEDLPYMILLDADSNWIIKLITNKLSDTLNKIQTIINVQSSSIFFPKLVKYCSLDVTLLEVFYNFCCNNNNFSQLKNEIRFKVLIEKEFYFSDYGFHAQDGIINFKNAEFVVPFFQKNKNFISLFAELSYLNLENFTTFYKYKKFNLNSFDKLCVNCSTKDLCPNFEYICLLCREIYCGECGFDSKCLKDHCLVLLILKSDRINEIIIEDYKIELILDSKSKRSQNIHTTKSFKFFNISDSQRCYICDCYSNPLFLQLNSILEIGNYIFFCSYCIYSSFVEIIADSEGVILFLQIIK